MDEPEMPAAPPPLLTTVQSIAELHAETLMGVSEAQLRIERFTRAIGRPWFAWAAAAFVASWIVVNLTITAAGGRAPDRPEFPWLELLVSLASLLMTVLILITENRMSELADRRAQVTLQMALLSEQKTAKVIAMLEQMRRDDPTMPDRKDPEAERMAEATDLRSAVQEMQTAQDRALAERNLLE